MESLISDMVSDLAEFEISDIEAAIVAYRYEQAPKGKGKFFPDSSVLRGLAGAERRDRLARERAATSTRKTESRPIMWWMLPKTLWAQHWRESDIPGDDRDAFHKRSRIATAAASYHVASDGPEF